MTGANIQNYQSSLSVRKLLNMAKEKMFSYANGCTAMLKKYGEQAVQCCINTWNQLCPDYPLTNLKEVTHRKRWVLFGSDVYILEQNGPCGHISKIVFGVNRRHTAKALQRNEDLPLMTLNCWIWWNCGENWVRGWSNRIVVDLAKNRVVDSIYAIPITPHVHWCPLP
jgi:hypothetical protein